MSQLKNQTEQADVEAKKKAKVSGTSGTITIARKSEAMIKKRDKPRGKSVVVERALCTFSISIFLSYLVAHSPIDHFTLLQKEKAEKLRSQLAQQATHELVVYVIGAHKLPRCKQ